MAVKLSLTYSGFNYVDYYNGEYDATNLQTLSNVEALGVNSIAETPDFGIDLADSTIYAGGGTTDTLNDETAAITDAKANHLTSFVRPLVDILYPQASKTYTDPQNYYIPNFFPNPSYTQGYNPADVPNGVTPASTADATAAIGDGNTDSYRGLIAPTDIGSLSKFFGSITTVGSYDYLIYNQAIAAANAGATLFSIGTELDSLANDQDPAVEKDWTDLIAAIRTAEPTLKLTYSANWASANQVTFWNKLDYVGIDGYVPLSNVVPTTPGTNEPTVQTLVNGWTTVSNVVVAYSDGSTVSDFTDGMSAIDYFDTLAQQSISGKFLFSEIGYQNDTAAATDPTGSSQTGVLDPTLQTNLYQAFYTAWGTAQQTAAASNGLYDNIPFALAGAYFWNYDPDPTTHSTSADNYDNWTLNPGALAVVEADNTSATPVVVAETGTASVAGYQGTPHPAVGTAGTSGTGALAGDSDPSGSTLSITAVAGGTVGKQFATTHGALTLNADGSYLYYYSGNATTTGSPAVDTISFTVSDALGNSTTSTLTLTGYRDPVAVNESGTVVAGATLTGTAGASGTGALAGDSDPDGAAINVGGYYTPQLNVTLPPIGSAIAGTYGTFIVNSDGSYSYTANSAASLASALVANRGTLSDGVTYIVSGPDGTYARPVSLFITITSPPPGPASYSWIGTSGDWQTAANWQNLTTGANPATSVPGSGDSASIAGGVNTPDTITGHDTGTNLSITNTVTLQGSFSLGTLTVGTSSNAATLTSIAPTSATSASVINGTLAASGGSLTVSGTTTLGGAAATDPNDSQSIIASNNGHIEVGTLVLAQTAGLYTPAYVSADATSTIEVGSAGVTGAAGAITVDSGATLSGTGTLGSNVVDNGTVLAQNGALYATQISGTGVTQIAAGAGIDVTSFSGANLSFLGTGDTAIIGGTTGTVAVTGFTAGDVLDLTGVAPGTATLNGTVLTAGAARYSFGDLTSTTPLILSADGNGGTDVTAVVTNPANTTILANELDQLEALVKSGSVKSISLGSSGGALSVTYAQAVADADALKAIVTPYTLNLSTTPEKFAGPTLQALGLGGTALTSVQFADGQLDFSTSSIPAEVYRLYLSAFGRVPDTGGQFGNDQLLETGTSLVSMAASFIGSAEFTARYGSTISDTQFVTQLYQNVLGRAPSSTDLNNNLAALANGTSRAQLLVNFSESQEHINDTASAVQAGLWDLDPNAAEVARLYDTMFGRLPDSAGLAYWAGQMRAGTAALSDVVNAFLGSAEFQAKYGSLNNSDFVTALYVNALHRQPDAGGLSFYVNTLNAGATRASVVLDFSESPEHQALTAANILNASPAQQGVQTIGAVTAAGSVIGADLDQFQSLITAGTVTSLSPTDPGTAAIPITLAQLSTDASALSFITGNFAFSLAGMTAESAASTVQAANLGTTTAAKYVSFSNGRLVFDTADPAAQIYRLYESAFGRAPDMGGEYNNTLALQNGTSLTSIAQSFIASQEFINHYGANVSDSAFVTLLYQNVLGRTPSSTDLNNNLNALANGTTRAQELVIFSESQEHINDTAATIHAGIYAVSS